MDLRIADLPKVSFAGPYGRPSAQPHTPCRFAKVTDMGFMGMKGGKLVNLDVSGLALTDVGLSWYPVAWRGRDLRCRSLRSHAVTGTCICSRLAEACPKLQNIQFHGCEKLSVHGLTALAERCTQLCKLDFEDNRALHGDWLKAMAVGFHRGTRSLRWVSAHRAPIPHRRASAGHNGWCHFPTA